MSQSSSDAPSAPSAPPASTACSTSASSSRATGESPARSALSLQVNGAPRRLPAGCSVSGLLEELGISGRRVAVAVNRDVVPRARFDAHLLAEGDRVEILEAVGGG